MGRFIAFWRPTVVAKRADTSPGIDDEGRAVLARFAPGARLGSHSNNAASTFMANGPRHRYALF